MEEVVGPDFIEDEERELTRYSLLDFGFLAKQEEQAIELRRVVNAEGSVVEDLESDGFDQGERGPISGDDDYHWSHAAIRGQLWRRS